MKRRVRLTESGLRRIIKESVDKILRENEFHRAYKSGKRLDGVGSRGTFTDSDVWEELDRLKNLLRQAEERAKTGQYDEGEARNYLTGAIRGLESFIKARNL